ncbi:MAG: glycine--tRNA ligase subunit beta, partial [Massilia sp.]
MADTTSVLVVEDEPAIVELVTYSLREAGWEIRTADTAAGAWDSISRGKPDLLLLDWMLPDQSGLRLLSRLRADRDFQELPVIMLTAKSMEEDKLAGLNSGADDYITKPFSPRELLARSRALLRRKSPHLAEAPLRAGSVTLDPNSCTVTVENQQIDIGNAEYKLLKYLLAHRERVFSRAQLLDKAGADQVLMPEALLDEVTALVEWPVVYECHFEEEFL